MTKGVKKIGQYKLNIDLKDKWTRLSISIYHFSMVVQWHRAQYLLSNIRGLSGFDAQPVQK